MLPFHIGTQRFSGKLLRVFTEQKVPGTGVQAVQFQVVKEIVAEAVVARKASERMVVGVYILIE